MTSPWATLSGAKVALFTTWLKKIRGGPLGTICRSTGTVTVPFTAFEVKVIEPEEVPTGSPVGSIAKNGGGPAFLSHAPPLTAVSETVRVPCPALLRLTVGEKG